MQRCAFSLQLKVLRQNIREMKCYKSFFFFSLMTFRYLKVIFFKQLQNISEGTFRPLRQVRESSIEERSHQIIRLIIPLSETLISDSSQTFLLMCKCLTIDEASTPFLSMSSHCFINYVIRIFPNILSELPLFCIILDIALKADSVAFMFYMFSGQHSLCRKDLYLTSIMLAEIESFHKPLIFMNDC